MNPALWAAKTGLDAQQTRMTVTSHNLANVTTTGFKKGRAVFEDLMYQNVRQVGGSIAGPDGADRFVARPRHTRRRDRKELQPGQPAAVPAALDAAISGRGFFQILLPDGTHGLHARRRLRGQRRRASW